MSLFPSFPLLLLFCAFFAGGHAPRLDAAQDIEEEVWASVLNTFVSAGTERLIIGEAALAIRSDLVYGTDLPRHLPGIRTELILSFVEANATSRFLPGFAHLDVDVVRLGEAGMAPFRSAGDPDEYWRAFYASYPHSPGLIRVSRVGFDPSRQQALVFVDHSCGGRCGNGAFLVLSHAGGSWRVIGRHVIAMR